MAEPQFYLTRTSHEKLKRVVRLNQPLGGNAPRRNLISPGDPEIVRLGKLYGGVTAATFDGSKTLTQAKKCEVLLHRIRADGSTMEAFEDTPEVGYWIFEQAGDDGNEVVCLRDRSINDPANPNIAQPGWVVFPLKPRTASDVPSICVGMGTSASAQNIFTTNGTSDFLAWDDDDVEISDTSVFGTNYLVFGAGLFGAIECKVAGTYRAFYHLRTNADSTHTASQIQRAAAEIVLMNPGTFAETIAPRSTSVIESLHIDAIDMGTGLGAFNGQGDAETLVQVPAGHYLLVRFLFSTGNPRGLKVTGESFGAQLVKRA